jgi:hypothetical protein
MNLKLIFIINLMLLLSAVSCDYSASGACEEEAATIDAMRDPCEFAQLFYMTKDPKNQDLVDYYTVQCLRVEMKLKECRKIPHWVPEKFKL